MFDLLGVDSEIQFGLHSVWCSKVKGTLVVVSECTTCTNVKEIMIAAYNIACIGHGCISG